MHWIKSRLIDKPFAVAWRRGGPVSHRFIRSGLQGIALIGTLASLIILPLLIPDIPNVGWRIGAWMAFYAMLGVLLVSQTLRPYWGQLSLTRDREAELDYAQTELRRAEERHAEELNQLHQYIVLLLE